MNLTPKQLESMRLAAAGILAAALGASAVLAQSSCTPEQQAKAAKAEVDLCRLRVLAAGFEALNPELRPPAGSLRAQLEEAENKFCAHDLDGAQGEGGSQ